MSLSTNKIKNDKPFGKSSFFFSRPCSNFATLYSFDFYLFHFIVLFYSCTFLFCSLFTFYFYFACFISLAYAVLLVDNIRKYNPFTFTPLISFHRFTFTYTYTSITFIIPFYSYFVQPLLDVISLPPVSCAVLFHLRVWERWHLRSYLSPF